MVLVAGLLLAGWRLWGSLVPDATMPAGGRISAIGDAGVNTDTFTTVGISPDWAAAIRESGGSGRDPFRYGAAPAPPAPPPPPPPETSVQPPPSFTPVAPPPPPLPLRYLGYGRMGGPDGDLKAILMAEDGVPYPAQTGETVLGRFRVQEVTREFAIVEDLQSGRRERLPVELPQ